MSSTSIDLVEPAPEPGSALFGGPWFYRFFLFLAIAALALAPAALVFPTIDANERLVEGLGAGIGFLVAAGLARSGRGRPAVAVAAATLLLEALLGALAPGRYAAEALGITVIATVLVLPATSRGRIVPALLIVGAIGSTAIAIDRLTSGGVDASPSPVGSVWSAVSVLAITLALVGWTHVRLGAAIAEARRARADLDASEDRYRTLVETAPDGIVIVNPATFRMRSANRRAAEIFGFRSAEELIAAEPMSLFPPTQPDGRGTAEAGRELVTRTLTGATVVRELVYQRADGTPFTAEIRSTLASIGGQEAVRLSVTDVSDRVAALRARDLTEARFRSLFASSPNAVLVVDAEGRIVDASDRAVDVFGYSTEVLRTLGVEDLVPPAERERHAGLREELHHGVAHPPVGAREIEAIRADGSIIPVEVGLSWFETSEGWFATAIVVDVTARRASEQAVRDATETIRAIFDASPAGIAVTSLDGTVRLWNEAMERLTGFTADEVIGGPDPSVPASRTVARAAIRAAVAESRTVAGADLVLARSDGTTFPAIGSFGPLRDASGTVVSLVAVVDDVSAMRSLEAQVNRKARLEAIGQLAGGIAHDINNVLTAIGGFATLTLEDLDAGQPVDREAIETIAAGAARTGALTRQLLAFARRDVRPAETIHLGDVVRSVEPMLRGLIGEHITLETQTTGDGHVRVAASHVEQIVVNLVVNARDAMPSGGRIRIDVSSVGMNEPEVIGRHIDVAPGAYVALSVTDDGTGMPPEVAERVFDPFFTTKGPDEGTGLGLATVHGIVTGAGGTIWVYSEPGVGTTFRILLPEVDAAPVAVGPPVDDPARGEETVLLVEDEDVVRSLACRVLERAGFAVLAVGDPEEALELAATHPGRVDLLLTDVIMPRIQGPELAERIAAVRPGLRVLFTSGYTAGGAGVTAAIPTDARFIDKPFTPSGLVAAVRAALDALPPS